MTRDPDVASLFPSLEKLSRAYAGKVPFVQQLEMSDCGAACLAMVLRMFGRHVALDEVRESLGSSQRDGLDAATLVRGAEWYGLRGRGLSVDVDQLTYLPAGAILHWEFKHFVVFERISKRGLHIVDPAVGARIVPHDKVRESFTGVALVFDTTDAFEPRRRGAGRLAWYVRQLRGQSHVLWRIVVTSALLRVLALALPLVTALVVDRVVPRADRSLLGVVAVGLFGLLAFQFVTTLLRAHLLLQMRTNLDTRLTLGFVDYLCHLPIPFFQSRSTGDLMMRVNSNNTVRETLTTSALSALLDGLLVVGYAVLMLCLAPVMATVVIALGAVQVAVYAVSRRSYREVVARQLEAEARSQSYLVEMLSGMETLKSSAAESRAVERWSNLYVDEVNASVVRGQRSAFVEAIVGLLATASPLLTLILGSVQVIDGALTLGGMLAMNAVAIGFVGPLSTMVNGALQLQSIGTYMDRIDDVLKTAPEQHGQGLSRAPRLTGRVTLHDVAFRYGEHARFAVSDVSVDIRPGMMLAIVGRSGCGKSSLARLIAGLYRPTRGRVAFDGHDLAGLDLTSLRRQIGLVSQSQQLFAGSIRSAIALADPGAPLDRICEAARLAAIHDEVLAMPMGYETLLADRGASLSGGQRQRIAIARALLQEPPLLILDEATSALDAETERRVMENVSQLACTRIVLAHRLSTVIDADLILVMDDGMIVETGTHHELLARGGHYARLVAAQLTDRRATA